MILSWLPPLGFTIFIYATLSTVSQWWEIIFSTYKPAAIKTTGATAFLLLLSSTIFYLSKKKHGPSVSLWLLAITGCYVVLFLSIDNIVEQVHIVEYGILAILYYLPVKKIMRGFPALYAAWLITFSAGIIDEWIQYYLPTRVGVLPDIYLNAVSAALPLLFLVKVIRVPVAGPVSSRCIRISGCLSVFFLLVLGSFVSTVTDPGYRHVHQESSVFYSRFSIEELKRRDAQEDGKYAAIIQDLYPVKMHTYLKDEKAVDKYAMEILVHLFRRDEHERKGSFLVAVKENSLLNAYFGNIISRAGHSWTPEKESAFLQKIKSGENSFYESPVSRDEILVSFSHRALWGIIGLLICGVTGFVLKSYSYTYQKDFYTKLT